MTLNITIVAEWGIWQCSDHRLTNPHTGELEDDTSVKHISFRFPDGGALLAYAGVGRIFDVQISDWVREILRGESMTLDESLIFLREEATKSIGPHIGGRYRHMVSIGAFLQQNPWIVQIRNFDANKSGNLGLPEKEFRTVAQKIEGDARVFTFGTPGALAKKDFDELTKIAINRPNQLDNFHGLLARYNRKAASHPSIRNLISEACATSFLPPEAEPISSKLHSGSSESSVQITIPTLLFGIDLTDMLKLLMSRFTTMQEESDSSGSKDTELDRTAQRGVEPVNRLRKNGARD